MATGTVSWIDPIKRCGFITCDEDGRDHFVQASNFAEGSQPLLLGAAVRFEHEDGLSGRLIAAKVELRTARQDRVPG